MASVNRVDPLLNHEGVPARRIGPLAQLERSVLSCLLWEDEFYEDGQTIAARIAALVKEVPAADVARVAVRAKLDMRLRHVPLLLARELLRTPEGRAEFGAVAAAVFARPDDLAEFLAIYWQDNKAEPLAKQAKRHLGEAFRKFDEYQLAKYNGGKKAVKLRDALRITRPKPDSPEQAELWRKLVKGELATPDTWEVELSKGIDKKASWERLLREPNPTNPSVPDAESVRPGQNLATSYADLAAVVAAWPTLPDPIRRAVLAIVQTAIPSPTGSTLRQLDDRAPAGYEPGQQDQPGR